ncbi:nucleotidyltransferase domain-containing protein [Thermus caldifontis]|uniref:nucleotidyltransferase domain-containing protein n=1 Tax=Thermus caldifontis TaxID=1930763 RepID=UPI000DF191FE|nr:nucleotidyltransferase domain-containing protein [Thermus caldifontis]
MPAKSLNSAVLRWPSREEVEGALQAWLARHPIPGLLALGYFGSYARGDHGVGSDLDLLLLVESSSLPPWQRSLGLPLEELPVPTEALVYTLAEWQALPQWSPRFAETLGREVRWLFRHPTLSLP